MSTSRGFVSSMVECFVTNVVDQAKAKLRAWVEKHRQAVLFDEESSLLMDVASGKTIRVAWQDLSAFEEKLHPETKDTYLVLLFENGKQIALVDPGGIAFVPSTGKYRTAAGSSAGGMPQRFFHSQRPN